MLDYKFLFKLPVTLTKLCPTSINPFAAVLTSYLVMRKLVAVCPYDEYTRHESHSSNA